MAKLQLFSVFDSKVGAFAAPFCCRTRGEAIRSFTDACRDKSLPFINHPGDYRLFFLGYFDESNGSLMLAVDNASPEPVIGADEIGEV